MRYYFIICSGVLISAYVFFITSIICLELKWDPLTVAPSVGTALGDISTLHANQ